MSCDLHRGELRSGKKQGTAEAVTCSLAFRSRVGSVGAALIEMEGNPNEIRIGPPKYAMGSGVVGFSWKGSALPFRRRRGQRPPVVGDFCCLGSCSPVKAQDDALEVSAGEGP